MFRKVLVANRAEIAIRVMRACRELDVRTVAVYSDADRDALHVSFADEAYRIGPPPAAQSYLNADRIFEVAKTAGCDALHPGYGFFAENAAFARRCASEGLTFIGPSPEAIDRMGDKVAARRAASAANFPVVPGTLSPIDGVDGARAAAKEFGYPIAIKAAAGGGGKGLKVARNAREVEQAVTLAAKEATAYFKDGTLYVERYLERPKHVEVQVLGDKHGHVVHLGERDCSLQRRHQKLVEETPATIAGATRQRLHDAAVSLASTIGYDSAGTIECLVEGDDFYFLEMNTRIQVEHTITEATWGVDLVKAQLRVAAGERLWFEQSDLYARGHAIECRINAESPARGFAPSAGRIEAYVAPSGPGIRVDGAAMPGWVIPQDYDSLVAKLIAWGVDRDEARRRMLRALSEYTIRGVETTLPFLSALIADDRFAAGRYATPDVEEFLQSRAWPDAGISAHAPTEAGGAEHTLTVEVNDRRFVVRVYGVPATRGEDPRRTAADRAPRRERQKKVAIDGRSVPAPMHGIVAEIKVSPGDAIVDGQVVAVIEAMKMMNEVVAHRSGTIRSVDAAVGDTVETGAPVVTLRE